MTYGEIFVLCFIGFGLFLLIVGIITTSILNWLEPKQWEKLQKQYPEVFEAIEENNKAQRELWDALSKHDEMRKRIDELMHEVKYLPKEERKNVYFELEDLRQLAFEYNTQTIEPLRLKAKMAREECEFYRDNIENKKLQEIL